MPANILSRSGRRGELKENRRHHIVRAASGQCQLMMSACSMRSVTPRSIAQLARFFLRQRRKIDRQDVEALLGQEYAVAALAIGDRQRALTLSQQMRLRFEKSVRRGAEQIAGLRQSALASARIRSCSCAAAENRAADAHMRRAERNRVGKSALMPIDNSFRPLRLAILAVSAKCGPGASSAGGMHISPDTRQAVIVAARGQKCVGILRQHAGLLRLGAGIDLREQQRRCGPAARSPSPKLRTGCAVDRMNGVEQRHRFLGLVRLQRPDQMQRDARMLALSAAAICPWPPARGSRRTRAGRPRSPARLPLPANVFDTATSSTSATSRPASRQARAISARTAARPEIVVFGGPVVVMMLNKVLLRPRPYNFNDPSQCPLNRYGVKSAGGGKVACRTPIDSGQGRELHSRDVRSASVCG